MADRQFQVTCKGPSGARRQYVLVAKNANEARSLIEEQERKIAAQDGVEPYQVDSVAKA